jgi:hypothetical protein
MGGMSETVRVVARFNDGRILKGSTQDFYQNRPRFHLAPNDGGPPVEVRCADLKAVMFVKTFEGDPKHIKLRGFLEAPAEGGQGRKVAVRFKDGELLCGYTLSYSPDREGFFITPVDTNGNNIRVYVLTAAATEVKAGPAADDLARRLLGT